MTENSRTTRYRNMTDDELLRFADSIPLTSLEAELVNRLKSSESEYFDDIKHRVETVSDPFEFHDRVKDIVENA